MEEILPKTSAFPTYTTIMAVIDILGRIVVPEFANVTVIPSRSFATANAELAGSLCTSADHTEHIFGRLSIQYMVFCFVVAQSTSKPSIAS